MSNSSGAMGLDWLRLRFLAAQSVFATRLSFRTDGTQPRLVHSVTDRPAYLLELGSGTDRFLLLDLEAPAMQGGSVIPVLRERTSEADPDQMRLRHLGTGGYVSAQGGSDNVILTVETADLWESFQTFSLPALQAERMPPGMFKALEVVRHCGGWDAMVSPAGITALTARNDPFCSALAGALIQFFEPDALQPLVDTLAALPAYPAVFPALQHRMSNRVGRLYASLRRQLADDIARYGWQIGDHSYGLPAVIEAHLGRLTIGRYCSCQEFTIILGNHVMDRVSTYPFASAAQFWPTAQVRPQLQDHVARDVTIGNDVWIGHRAVILPGAQVGDGAVIGAHAVARGDIPPYAVFAGNPGRIVRYRFDPDTIARLLRTAWWHWPDHEVDRCIPLILDPDINRFLDYAEHRGAAG